MFLYLLPVVGVHATMHYCGGKFVSVSFSNDEGKCCCGNTKMKKGCCENKEISLKMDESHQKANEVFFNVADAFQMQPVFTEPAFDFFKPLTSVLGSYESHRPPDVSKQPIYLKNRVFRI